MKCSYIASGDSFLNCTPKVALQPSPSLQLLVERDFEDYRDPATGDVVFPRIPPHRAVQMLAKRL